LTGAPAGADELEQGLAPESCIVAAGAAYRVPPAVLLILLNVEDGALGQVSSNANGTVDIGPMQVNQIWLPKLAAHWKAPVETAYTALRDDFCANVEGGAWILRQAIDEAQGDFWAGVGHYHSHDPAYEARYLRLVLSQARNLQTEAAVTSVQDSGQGD
jgi:soluble lytic murein transglycosylase-like protein